jgi:hypothetical protein
VEKWQVQLIQKLIRPLSHIPTAQNRFFYFSYSQKIIAFEFDKIQASSTILYLFAQAAGQVQAAFQN